MNDITHQQRVKRSPDLVSTDMDDEIVMMSIEKGEYYGIGGVGTDVWILLQEPMTIDEILDRVCPEYEVSEATCRSEIEAFVSEMLKRGLVITC